MWGTEDEKWLKFSRVIFRGRNEKFLSRLFLALEASNYLDCTGYFFFHFNSILLEIREAMFGGVIVRSRNVIELVAHRQIQYTDWRGTYRILLA